MYICICVYMYTHIDTRIDMNRNMSLHIHIYISSQLQLKKAEEQPTSCSERLVLLRPYLAEQGTLEALIESSGPRRHRAKGFDHWSCACSEVHLVRRKRHCGSRSIFWPGSFLGCQKESKGA